MQPYGSSREESLALMRKRHALFTDIVKDYTSFDDFMRDWDEKMALWGVEATQGEYGITLYLLLEYIYYEYYDIGMGKDGHLEVDPIVTWNYLCTTTDTNIFTNEDV